MYFVGPIKQWAECLASNPTQSSSFAQRRAPIALAVILYCFCIVWVELKKLFFVPTHEVQSELDEISLGETGGSFCPPMKAFAIQIASRILPAIY